MSRELDAKVAEAMGWDIAPEFWTPSTDNEPAWDVVERMRELGWLCQIHISQELYWVRFSLWYKELIRDGMAESERSLGEAICIAFIRAVGLEWPKSDNKRCET